MRGSPRKHIDQDNFNHPLLTELTALISGKRTEALAPDENYNVPSKFTDEDWDKLFAFIAAGNTAISAFEMMNVKRSTMFVYFNRHASDDIKKRFQEAREAGRQANLWLMEEMSNRCLNAPPNIIANINFMCNVMNSVNDKLNGKGERDENGKPITVTIQSPK